MLQPVRPSEPAPRARDLADPLPQEPLLVAVAQRDQARIEHLLRHWVHRRGLAALDALIASPQLADLGPECVCWLQEQLRLVAPATAVASASFTASSSAASFSAASSGSISVSAPTSAPAPAAPVPAAPPVLVSAPAPVPVVVAASEAEASEYRLPAFVQQLVEQTKTLDREPVAPIEQESPQPLSLNLESPDLEALDLESRELEAAETYGPIGGAVPQHSSLAGDDLGAGNLDAACAEPTLTKGVWPQLSVVPDGAPAPALRSLAPLRAWLPDAEPGVRRLGQDRRDLPLAS